TTRPAGSNAGPTRASPLYSPRPIKRSFSVQPGIMADGRAARAVVQSAGQRAARGVDDAACAPNRDDRASLSRSVGSGRGDASQSQSWTAGGTSPRALYGRARDHPRGSQSPGGAPRSSALDLLYRRPYSRRYDCHLWLLLIASPAAETTAGC